MMIYKCKTPEGAITYQSFPCRKFSINLKFRKLLFLTLFILFTGKVVAPEYRSILIADNPPVKPFNGLIYAVGMVESMGDTLAYNKVENAIGFFQIRQVRLNDYYKRTGKKYKLKDMFNYELSEEVFLYYASEIGPYNFEKIAKNWNGSGPKTIGYWKRVKKHL